MNIDSMKVNIRPMSTMQALDLGMAMARHWFVPLWKIWLGIALPIYLLFYVGGILVGMLFDVSISDSLGMLSAYSGLLFWWLKPFYEKPMIGWLGEALFTEAPTIKKTIGTAWKNTSSYAFVLLFKKRLSLKRQLILPILMLEKPNKVQLKERLQILSRGQSAGIGWHTILMVHIEVLITLATILLFWQLIPTGLVKASTLFIFLEYAPIWVEVFFGVLYFLAVSIVAPFFVASGFAVYLTKRCLLEGWDVELVFKDLRQRYDYDQASPLSEFSNPINSQLDTKNSLVVNERSITNDSEHLLPELETLYDNNGQPL